MQLLSHRINWDHTKCTENNGIIDEFSLLHKSKCEVHFQKYCKGICFDFVSQGFLLIELYLESELANFWNNLAQTPSQ